MDGASHYVGSQKHVMMYDQTYNNIWVWADLMREICHPADVRTLIVFCCHKG